MKVKNILLLIVFIIIFLSIPLIYFQNITKPNLKKMDSELRLIIQNVSGDNNLDKIVPILLTFDSQLSEKQISEIKSLGVNFSLQQDQIVHMGTIYPANATVRAIIILSNQNHVKKIEFGGHKYVPL
jgi:hypothetical protein